jgi:hypothetical protein
MRRFFPGVRQIFAHTHLVVRGGFVMLGPTGDCVGIS